MKGVIFRVKTAETIRVAKPYHPRAVTEYCKDVIRVRCVFIVGVGIELFEAIGHRIVKNQTCPASCHPYLAIIVFGDSCNVVEGQGIWIGGGVLIGF